MDTLTHFRVQTKPGKPFTILQLTDMQLIDAEQRRYPERLGGDEPFRWMTEKIDQNALDPIRKTVDIAQPDLIVVTGDLIYGEFDDAGTSHHKLVDCFSSLGIPWAPVFGNHDNETAMGVDWQCDLYSHAKNCLFARGELTGNCNYTIGIYDGDTLIRVLYMMDSNTCFGGTDPALHKECNFGKDQLDWVADTAAHIRETVGHTVPGFFLCHIPTVDVFDILVRSGYATLDDLRTKACTFRIGNEPVDIETTLAPAHPGDFGYMDERMGVSGKRLQPMFQEAGIDGFFCGHCHQITLSVQYDTVRYTFGVKCGTYDYHRNGMLGGTKITLGEDSSFAVEHIYQGETV